MTKIVIPAKAGIYRLYLKRMTGLIPDNLKRNRMSFSEAFEYDVIRTMVLSGSHDIFTP
jgi:hypothetical protein